MAKRRKPPAILPEQWYDVPYSPEDFATALTAAQSHAVSMVVSGGALTTSTIASENHATGFSDTSCKVAAALFGTSWNAATWTTIAASTITSRY